MADVDGLGKIWGFGGSASPVRYVYKSKLFYRHIILFLHQDEMYQFNPCFVDNKATKIGLDAKTHRYLLSKTSV